MTTGLIRGSVWEDGGATVMARVIGNAGTAITQASLTSIHYSLFDTNGATPETAVVAGTSLTVSDVVFDTLQTDARWTQDATGYNFRHTIAASVLAAPAHLYRAEYKFTPTSGEVFWVVAEILTLGVSTS